MSQSNTQIIVFHMHGCPACKDYLPRFRRLAKRYERQIPIFVLDANAPQHAELANRLGASYMPATYVLRRPTGVLKAEGAVDDAEIERMLQTALAYR